MHEVAPAHFRAVMGHFATGVTVVTATGPDGPVGMTANAVCSLSLEPLLLLVCFDNGSRTLPVVRASERFGVNVLARGQEELARRFAGKLPEAEKFAGVEHTMDDGVPVIEGAHAWILVEDEPDAVLVNASTAFTDGAEFGMGAEIGISTQKLHARGPMGLPELTSTKYVVTGNGHTR